MPCVFSIESYKEVTWHKKDGGYEGGTNHQGCGSLQAGGLAHCGMAGKEQTEGGNLRKKRQVVVKGMDTENLLSTGLGPWGVAKQDIGC